MRDGSIPENILLSEHKPNTSILMSGLSFRWVHSWIMETLSLLLSLWHCMQSGSESFPIFFFHIVLTLYYQITGPTASGLCVTCKSYLWLGSNHVIHWSYQGIKIKSNCKHQHQQIKFFQWWSVDTLCFKSSHEEVQRYMIRQSIRNVADPKSWSCMPL